LYSFLTDFYLNCLINKVYLTKEVLRNKYKERTHIVEFDNVTTKFSDHLTQYLLINQKKIHFFKTDNN